MAQIRHVIVSPTPPTGEADWRNFAWIDTEKRVVCLYDEGWTPVAAFSEEGVSAKITVGKQTLVFENGILVKVNPSIEPIGGIE